MMLHWSNAHLITSGYIQTWELLLPKKQEILSKKAQNIMKRKENAWILTKKAGIPAFSWKFSCLYIFTLRTLMAKFGQLQKQH